MSRDIQTPRPDPFPARREMVPTPMPVFVPWHTIPYQQPCLVEQYNQSLPPSERGKIHILMLSCPCRRCSPWALSV